MNSLVVKLGGSNAAAPELALWLGALAGAGLPIVIVPGGGPFADHIRDAQHRLDFSDKAAHSMAILAMEQFGHLLLDRDDRFLPARTLSDIRSAMRRSRAAVWLPAPLALWANELPASWDTTSDSIAAWLAGGLVCRSLLLVKQSDAVRAGMSVPQLTGTGIVDAGLEALLPDDVALHIAGPRHAASAAKTFAEGGIPGVVVDAHAEPVRKAG
ncbi:MAG: dihydroneopterin aldolase [Rhizobiaceae bacterium]